MRKFIGYMLGIFSLFLFAFAASAQIPGSMTETTNMRLGGSVVIVGTIFRPDGRPADTRMLVRLRTPTRGDHVMSSDTAGQFVFSGLPEGRYTVVVDGDGEVEPFAQEIEAIPYSVGGQKSTFTVTIKLRERWKAPGKAAVTTAGKVSDKRQASLHYAKALELSKNKDHAGAIEELVVAVPLDPSNVDIINELGVQYQRTGELAKAEEVLLTAIKLKADAYEPRLNLAIVLFRANRLREADLALNDVLKLNDKSALAHFYLGRSLAKQKEYAGAETALRTSLKLGGDAEMKEAHRALAMLYIDKDDRPAAAASLETYLALAPSAPDAEQLKHALGQLRAAIGKP